jgi:hypothetical protein
MQTATFSGAGGIEHLDGKGGDSSVASNGLDGEQAQGSGAGADPDSAAGMVRYPTEPPVPPSASEERRIALPWRGGAIGAIAGAAGSALAMALMRRRRKR